MSALFGFMGLLSLFIGFVMFVIALIRRKPKKQSGVIMLSGLVLFIVGVSLPSSEDIIEKGEEVTGVSTSENTEEDEGENNDGLEEKDEEDELGEDQSIEKDTSDVEKNSENETNTNVDTKKDDSTKEDSTDNEVDSDTNGANPADMYGELVSLISDGKVELPEESYQLINENESLFPAESDKEISELKDITNNEVGSKHLNKKVSLYFSDIITIAGGIISIEEDDIDGETLTYIHMLDDDFNSFEIILNKSADDVFEDDYIRFWGIPVGANHFENISGGTTNSQVIIGSHVEKQ